MSKDVETQIKNLEKKIDTWTRQLNMIHNNTERTLIGDKIANARKLITELKTEKPKVEVTQQIDAPSVADKGPVVPQLQRGQIMNAGDAFYIGSI